MTESKTIDLIVREYDRLDGKHLQSNFIKDISKSISRLLRIYSVDVILRGRDSSIAQSYMVGDYTAFDTHFEWLTVLVQGNLVPIRKYRLGTKKKEYILKCTVLLKYELSCNFFECGSRRCEPDMCYSKNHICNVINVPFYFIGTKKVHTKSTNRSITAVVKELFDSILSFVGELEMSGDKIFKKNDTTMDMLKVGILSILNEDYDIGDTEVGNIKLGDVCMVCFEPTKRSANCCNNKCCMSCVGKLRNRKCPICRDSGPELVIKCTCNKILWKDINR